MALTVKIRTNIGTVNRKIGQIDKRFKNLSLMSFGKGIAKRAKFELRQAYVSDRASQRTGDLEASIEAVSIEAGKEVHIIAPAEHGSGKNRLAYGGVVEEGRGEVHAKPGKWLHFIGRNGEDVYRKSVGPTEGKHFMQKAFSWGSAKAEAYADKRVKRIIKSGGEVDDFDFSAEVVI